MNLTSLGLKKPAGTDPVDVQDFNDNADLIDQELTERPKKDGDASEMTVTFTEAEQLTELASNDSLRGLFGKLKLAVKNVISFAEIIGALTADVTEIRVVSSLPEDAAAHVDTLYLIVD